MMTGQTNTKFMQGDGDAKRAVSSNLVRGQHAISRHRSPGQPQDLRGTEAPVPPVDLSHHFSTTTSRREGSLVKEFYKYFGLPGIQNLAGGQPHVSYFPFDTLEATVASPNRIEPSRNASQTSIRRHERISTASGRILVPKESDTHDISQKIDLATALQYSATNGYPPLLSFIRQFVRENLHPNVPYQGGPDVILTCGSTDGFSKTIEAFTNVWSQDKDWIGDREGILCEEYTYMNAIQTVKPRGLNIVPVAMDSQGMCVHGKGGLVDVLENWDFSKGRRPHLMYTVTIGQNPSGAVLPVSRRREIYALCQKYDIIIIEDEPYFHLQYPSARALEFYYRGQRYPSDTTSDPNYNAHRKSSGFEFLDSLVPSYLSTDTDGRVVRLDTFSKSIAPGCRVGWLTAQPKVVERILRITETSTQCPSGFAQAMIAQLLVGDQGDSEDNLKNAQAWKVDGWVRWLEGLRGGYERRMQSMCTVLEESKFVALSNTNSQDTLEDWEVVDRVQMFDFHFPRAGMFVWIRVCLETHPLWAKVTPDDLGTALWKHLMKKPYLCLTAPGSMFAPTDEVKQNAWQYLRVSFAALDAPDIDKVSHSLVEGFRSFWQIRNPDDLDDEV
ncbi:hypothetical protein VTO42DRAFT_2228 [Malbranchea cinnamomea]